MKAFTYIREVDLMIFDLSGLPVLQSLFCTCTYFQEFDTEWYWKLRIERDFSGASKHKSPSESSREQYIGLFSFVDKGKIPERLDALILLKETGHTFNVSEIEDISYVIGAYGDMEMLKWVDSQQISLNYVGKFAAEYGHLEILKWLHNEKGQVFDYKVLNVAIKNNQLEILKWLLKIRPLYLINLDLDHAGRRGYLEILKLLFSHECHCISSTAIGSAALAGHFNILEWSENVKIKPEWPVINMYNLPKSIDGVKWLLERGAYPRPGDLNYLFKVLLH